MAILFDLDGTLVDSLPVIIKTSRKACAELGITVDERTIIDHIGLPLRTTGEELLGRGRGQEYFDTYQKYYYDELSAGLAVFDGMKELLAELQTGGEKMAVVTSKSRRGAEATIAEAQMKQYFPVCVTIDDTREHKPLPTPALYALQLLGDEPQNSIFVGDSPFDMRCGRAAGCFCCGVLWGAGTEEQLREAGAQVLCASVDELRAALTQKSKAL